MSRTPKYYLFALLLTLALLLAACTMPASGPQGEETPSTTAPAQSAETPTPDDQPSPGGETISGLAAVESIDIRTLESFPVRVQVVASGNLPDGCTTIDETLTERIDQLFRVTITTSRPADAICTEALVPFDQVVELDVVGLPAGEYQVDVNGVTGSFTLQIDNTPPTEDVPTPSAGNSSISGVVWHDLCAVAGGEGDTPAIPSAGCIQLEDGSYQANGILEEEEPRLEGIEVLLGSGACPSSGLASATTNGEGEYTFENLAAGMYCVSVQEDSLNNGPILIPGVWSAPKTGAAETPVELDSGQQRRGIFFGWDFQNLPEPDPVQDETACTNEVSFVEDVTYPDDSQVSGGEAFVKTWRLSNDGTCTWTTGYSLVFAGEDQLGAASPQPITSPVEPGEEAELSITFTAPSQAGTYRSEWLLRSAFGQEFGTGSRSDSPIWVQVQVVESAGDLGLGEPTWRETFDNAARWFLYNSGTTSQSIENGEMVLVSSNPGSFDEWGLSNYPAISDFYMEANFRTGETCSGLDRYGLLLRSPDPNQGYVLAFSCDGRYRLYAWDGTYHGLVEWTASSSIQTGPDQTNKMGVYMEGDTIKVYANDTLLAELEATNFSSGEFGLMVAAGNTPNFTTYVTDLTLWELDQ